jgi:ubiquinone/menaquinone biosynthesis C-methylase UbiE
MTQQSNTFASSTGQVMTGADWLDVHFEAKRPEYEAQLRATGIQPGWHVLDAACGSGSYLPCMAELVGLGGRLSALDLASDNVALVERQLLGWRLPCPVDARVGTVVSLPYSDDAFDAVWFANTSQYLTDEELGATLAEFRRVVRPGGLVAVKETDAALFRVFPSPPGLMLRWFQANASAGNVQAAGTLRAPALPGRLRQAGLLDVWQRCTTIERTAPFGLAARVNVRDTLRYLAQVAPTLDLPATDHEVWATFRDPTALEHYLDDPDCALLDVNILAIGTAPSAQKAH